MERRARNREAIGVEFVVEQRLNNVRNDESNV